MDPLTSGVWALALAVAGTAVTWFFKTPKESAGEMVRRMDDLEDRHHALDVDHAGFKGTVLNELHNLTNAINRLSTVLEHAGIITGEHRVVKRRGE